MLILHEICLIGLHCFQTHNYTQITEWVQSVTSAKIAYPSKELEDLLIYIDEIWGGMLWMDSEGPRIGRKKQVVGISHIYLHDCTFLDIVD